MASRTDDYLFAKYDGMAVRSNIIKKAVDEASTLSEDRVLNSDPEALVQYFIDKYNVEVPTIFRDRMVADRSEGLVPVWDHFDRRERSVQGVVFTFELPFDGEEDVFLMVPSTRNFNPPMASVKGRNIVFSISGREVSTDEIKRGVDEVVGGIEQYLGWHRQLWSGLDSEIGSSVRQTLEKRRERLLKQHEVSDSLASLGISLKEKASDPKTYAAPAIREKIVPALPPMRAKEKADPTLDETQYQTILKLLRDAGRSIERSSSRARELDEQTLRDILLVPLNAHFEGKATGEAFNFSGKTDILVRHDGGNLFVAECKIWSGEKASHQAIDQLLSYLTWRDTKTALVMFNRNANFTEVLSKLRSSTSTHSHCKSGPTQIDESTFRFTFTLPSDPGRSISLTVIGLDLGPSANSGPRITQL